MEALCQAPVPQSAEVASDIQLIKVSVALGLYIIKSSPELKQTVQDAMAAFLNRRVSKQGGWVSRVFIFLVYFHNNNILIIVEWLEVFNH